MPDLPCGDVPERNGRVGVLGMSSGHVQRAEWIGCVRRVRGGDVQGRGRPRGVPELWCAGAVQRRGWRDQLHQLPGSELCQNLLARNMHIRLSWQAGLLNECPHRHTAIRGSSLHHHSGGAVSFRSREFPFARGCGVLVGGAFRQLGNNRTHGRMRDVCDSRGQARPADCARSRRELEHGCGCVCPGKQSPEQQLRGAVLECGGDCRDGGAGDQRFELHVRCERHRASWRSMRGVRGWHVRGRIWVGVRPVRGREVQGRGRARRVQELHMAIAVQRRGWSDQLHQLCQSQLPGARCGSVLFPARLHLKCAGEQ
mmetsp:Transcript_17172/g.41592  ORF Transcript_17172/g.41592 Transcript_17172/m.41592 type:complete len:313 (+) Transcript_17172:937-1875(+)